MNSIIEAFHDEGFVCLRREEPATETQLVQLASKFGKIWITERHRGKIPGIQKVADNALFGCDEVPWHNDWSYGRGGYFGTLLYNKTGANIAKTYFVDMATACAALPFECVEALRECSGEYFPSRKLQQSCFRNNEIRTLEKIRVRRPLVFNHPTCSKPVLYFSPGTLKSTCGLDKTGITIDLLTSHCEDFQWSHDWQENDIVIFDNLRFMHRRDGFKGRRQLWRIQFKTGDSDPRIGTF